MPDSSVAPGVLVGVFLVDVGMAAGNVTQIASRKCCGGCCAESRGVKKGKTGSEDRRPGHPLGNENQSRLQAVVMTEALKFPYSVQGRGTVESMGNHFYRVCSPAGCTVVMGLSNALYLSRNVPESASRADP